MRYLLNIATALGLVGMTSTAAIAGPTYSFALNQADPSSRLSGSFGSVTLTQNGTNSVNVLVDLKPAGSGANFGFVNTGGPHTPFAFNLSSTLTSGLTATFSQPSGGSYTTAKGNTYSFSLYTSGISSATPYGNFSVVIDMSSPNGSSSGYFGDLAFTLTATSKLSTDDFATNSNGIYFAADLSDNTNTGSVAAGTRVGVPEPISLSLLGAGIAGISVVARRRRQATRTFMPC
jgi:hypothetical protein